MTPPKDRRPTRPMAWKDAHAFAAAVRRLKLPWLIGVRRQGSGHAVYATSKDPSVPVLPDQLPGWSG